MCSISRSSEGRTARRNIAGESMHMKSQEMVYHLSVANAGVQVVQG